MESTSHRLLVVEDRDDDYELLEWALERAGYRGSLQRTTRIDATLDCLLAPDPEDPFTTAVLLDLNLPDGNGFEILEALRDQPQVHRPPVVVVTTSANPRVVERCYQLAAAGYLVKPLDRMRFAEQIAAFVDYWLGAVTLPGQERSTASLG